MASPYFLCYNDSDIFVFSQGVSGFPLLEFKWHELAISKKCVSQSLTE